MSIHALIILAYFAMVSVVGFFTRRRAGSSASEYLVAGRNLGMLVCAVVVAAEWLGGMSTVGVSERAYDTLSLQPVFYNVSTAVGMVVIGFTVAAKYRRRGVRTVSGMIEFLFGARARSVSAVAFLVAYVTLAFVQLQTCAGVLAPLFGVGWTWAVVISAALITTYTYLGGMHALALSGIIYLCTMYLGLGTAFMVGLGKAGGLGGLSTALAAQGAPAHPFNPFSAGTSGALSLLVGGLLGGMAAQASIQPIFAARDERTARRAAVLSGLIVAPFGVMTAFLGLFARSGLFLPADSGVTGATALSTLLQTPSFIPPVLGGLALAGVLAAILSTVGPVNFAVVTIAAEDIYHGILNRGADDARIVAAARKLVVLTGVVTVPLAVAMRGSVLDTAYVSYAIRAIGAIVVLGGLYARRLVTPLGVQLAFILGTLMVFLSMAADREGWFTLDKTYGAVLTTLVILALTTAGNRLAGRRGGGRRPVP